MKHLKTFESFSTSELELVDEGIISAAKKFITGYKSDEERDEKKKSILDYIDQLEKESDSKNYKTWIKKDGKWSRSDKFNKSDLIKPAEKNNYKGVIQISKPMKGVRYVGYASGKSELHSMFSGGGGFMQ